MLFWVTFYRHHYVVYCNGVANDYTCNRLVTLHDVLRVFSIYELLAPALLIFSERKCEINERECLHK